MRPMSIFTPDSVAVRCTATAAGRAELRGYRQAWLQATPPSNAAPGKQLSWGQARAQSLSRCQLQAVCCQQRCAQALTLLRSRWVASGVHFGNLVHTDALSL